jgi:hypothetical protein
MHMLGTFGKPGVFALATAMHEDAAGHGALGRAEGSAQLRAHPQPPSCQGA